jgi:SAM-dependent methyltransferase
VLTKNICTKKNNLCSLCSSNKLDYNHYIVDGYAITRCKKCGLLFVDMDGVNSKNLYTRGYFEGESPNVYKRYMEEKDNRIRAFKPHLETVNRYFTYKGKLLEIGCASGYFLKNAKEDAWIVKGIEISEYAANFGRKEFGLDIDCEDVDEVDLGECQYDAVAMWDVIEHIKDPFYTLKKVWKALKWGGYIFFSTGNYDGLNAKIYGKNWFLLTPPHHLWYFSHRNLPRFMEKIGYRIVSCRGDGGLLNNGPRNKYTFYEVFLHWRVRRLLGKMNIGNSFFVVARK